MLATRKRHLLRWSAALMRRQWLAMPARQMKVVITIDDTDTVVSAAFPCTLMDGIVHTN